MRKLSALAAFAVLLAAPVLAQVAGQPVSIVAAENFYGDIAKQIGGPDVKVTSILSNPDQDPHLFEVSPSVGRDVSAARIVIYNGIDLITTRGRRSCSGLHARPSARRLSSPIWSGKRPATIRIFGTTRPWWRWRRPSPKL
jgi:Zinc-uptake complex component A periplasmic